MKIESSPTIRLKNI